MISNFSRYSDSMKEMSASKSRTSILRIKYLTIFCLLGFTLMSVNGANELFGSPRVRRQLESDSKQESLFKNVCDDDDADISCSNNQVIVITEARFGRTGSQITCSYNVNYDDKHVEVTSAVANKCSGLQNCAFNVNKMRKAHKWLEKDGIRSVLDIRYECVTVSQVSTCEQTQILLQEPLTLSSSNLVASSFSGSAVTPCQWTVRVSTNQWINLTVEYFLSNETVTQCAALGTIKEDNGTGKSSSLCGRRKTWNYLSESSAISIIINKDVISKERFLIHLSVVDCPLPEPISNGWIENLDRFDKTIHCNFTNHKWHMKCVGKHWHINNGPEVNQTLCSPSSVTTPVPVAAGNTGNSSNLVILLVMGVAIGVAIGVILLVIIVWCMWRRNKKKRGNFQCTPDPAVISDHTLKSCHPSCASLSNLSRYHVGYDPQYDAWMHQQRLYSTIDGSGGMYGTAMRPHDGSSVGTTSTMYRGAQYHHNHGGDAEQYPMNIYHSCNTPTRNLPYQYPELSPYRSPRTERRGMRTPDSLRSTPGIWMTQDRNLPPVPSTRTMESGLMANNNQPPSPSSPLYFQLDSNLVNERDEIESP